MLTGVYNRWRFMELAEYEFSRHVRFGAGFCLAMIDLDKFKEINDTYGHTAGDKVLQSFTDVCTTYLRECDIVGRYGGEEFILLLPETTPEDGLMVANRIRSMFEAFQIKFNRRTINATVSIGLSSRFNEDENIEAAIERADIALYQAKEAGRNSVKMAQTGVLFEI